MISKRQKLVLWSCFGFLVFLSALGVCFSLAMWRTIPMALNDSSPNFGQLAETDRWNVYHEAQSLMMTAALVMLAMTILWAVLAGFTIRWLSKKSEHESH